MIEKAAALPAPHTFDKPQEYKNACGVFTKVQGLYDAVEQLKRLQKPFLNWTGKAERLSFDVPTLPLFVHERLSTKAIIETLKCHRKQEKPKQLPLFDLFGDPQRPVTEQVLKAYEYRDKWVNRMILGDSLVVMNSLLHYEGLGGQVQMIYFDPPYGIKFGSNFQPFVRKRDVGHNDDEDMTREPEMVKAYRDTWELGLHSYLTYMRDRLLLSRDLLNQTGNIFVQISDVNLHHVRELMDEVFGTENFCSVISFKKTGGQSSSLIASVADYLLWYAKDKEHICFHPIYTSKLSMSERPSIYRWIESRDKAIRRKMTQEEQSGEHSIPEGWRIFAPDTLVSLGATQVGSLPYKFNGKVYTPGANQHWKTTKEGLDKLAEENRLIAVSTSIYYVRYLEDFPVLPFDSIWDDTSAGGYSDDKLYVVQTNRKVIQRCMLMTTDPGDLVLDPTCVREGTLVLIPNAVSTPLSPPVNWVRTGVGVNGGDADNNANGGKVGNDANGKRVSDNAKEEKITPSPFTGRVGVGCTPIETLKPGNYVYAHDGIPHRISRIIKRRYHGTMIGIRHKLLPTILWLTEDHQVLIQARRHAFTNSRDWSHVPGETFKRARTLRKEMTPFERKLWSKLRNGQLGAKFRRQHPVGPYIADFYCAERSLVVEIDGDSHFSENGKRHDETRTAYITNTGLGIIRFTNVDIRNNLNGVVERILEEIGKSGVNCPKSTIWMSAGTLLVGDTVFHGVDLAPVQITEIVKEESSEYVYDIEVEDAHSFLTEVCAVHNCGSGTTAYVAEQWGRRWITIDTSRVPLALARQRLLTTTFPYYQLKDEGRGPVGGFVYKRKQNKKGEEIGGIVPHVTLKSIANNAPPTEEVLVDRPEIDNKIIRVAGPFCVEATIPTPVDWEGDGVEDSGAGTVEQYGSFIDRMLEILRKSPVLHIGGGKSVTLKNIRPPAKTLSLSAEAMVANGDEKPVALLFGPENGAVSEKLVHEALKEANLRGYTHLYVIGVSIQPNARILIENAVDMGMIPATYVQATPDIMMGDLLKNMRSSQIFSVCGLPEVRLTKVKPSTPSPQPSPTRGEEGSQYQVEILGLDVLDPVTMELDKRSGNDVPAWFLDTDYNGLCFHVCQAFFPRTSAWDNLKRALKGNYDETVWEHLAGTTSVPFAAGEHGQIAVKVIDDRGNELMVVKGLKEVE
jgi:very-short-patch-repair endonuclease/DNA modification methylase